MRLSRTRPTDWVVGLAGAALIGLLFADWYGGESGWSALAVTDVVLALLALLAIAVPIVTAAQAANAIPIALVSFATLAGVVATVAIGVRLAAPPNGAGVDTGAWLGLAAGLVWTVAGALDLRDERRGHPPPPDPESIPVLPAPPRGDGGDAQRQLGESSVG
ncbi:MAG: hypothetical protein IRZ21_04490 [Thermoleophilaceae bacterium]|nr:hypothetical protein [Thermoleophilaceae bacterium]